MSIPLPTSPLFPDFDVYYVTSDHIGTLNVYATVNFIAPSGCIADKGDHLLFIGPDTGDTARAIIGQGVPDVFTFQARIQFLKLPPDFTNVSTLHAYIGTTDAQGAAFGLFFSGVGIAYTGNVNYDGLNTLQLNGPVQLLPGSEGLVKENTYYTLRVSVDSGTGIVYVYVTESDLVDQIGHQLRFILPALNNDDSVVPQLDGVYISVKGSTSLVPLLGLAEVGIASSLVIPNLPPIAQASNDQSARMCSIVQLDGRSSFDPEG
ncbi:MAG: hypothetical protein EBZ77_15860, partial [Chitinophagia bacterium]|nr:hypothetical protein [Chitinophagia bacterium]